jgi:hypothetical protein
MLASFPSSVPACRRRETDSHVQVVVVAAEHLDNGLRPAKPCAGPDEDSFSSSSNEEVDQRLGQPKINLANTHRRPLPPVEPWVVHVDIEAVLMRGVARAEPAAVRLAEVSDAHPRRARVAGGIGGDDAEDDANQPVCPPAPPRAVGLPVQQRIPREEGRAARRQLDSSNKPPRRRISERPRALPPDRAVRPGRERPLRREGTGESARDGRQQDQAE